MEIKREVINEQFAQAYFTFKAKEIYLMFAETELELADDKTKTHDNELDSVYKKIHSLIETEVQKLAKKIIFSIKTRFLRNPKKGEPLIVIAQYVTLPDNIPLDFSNINFSISNKTAVDEEEIEYAMKRIYIKYMDAKYNEASIVSKASKVIFDIDYMRLETVVQSLKDQETTISDMAVDFESFIGKKVGDIISLDKINDFEIIGKIKRILDIDNINFTDYEIAKLKIFNCSTLRELKNKITKIIKVKELIDKCIDTIIDYYYKNNIIKVDKMTLKIYADSENITLPKDKNNIILLEKEIIKHFIAQTVLKENPINETSFSDLEEVMCDEYVYYSLIEDNFDIDLIDYVNCRVDDVVIINYYKSVNNIKI